MEYRKDQVLHLLYDFQRSPFNDGTLAFNLAAICNAARLDPAAAKEGVANALVAAGLAEDPTAHAYRIIDRGAQFVHAVRPRQHGSPCPDFQTVLGKCSQRVTCIPGGTHFFKYFHISPAMDHLGRPDVITLAVHMMITYAVRSHTGARRPPVRATVHQRRDTRHGAPLYTDSVRPLLSRRAS